MSYYQDIFHTSNWEEATYEEKLAALQTLENDYAARQGRPPCKIQPEELDPEEIGYYYEKTNEILINKDLLNGLDPEHKWAHTCNYLCVNTILHEGRHAYQNHAMNHDVHPDNEEVRKWRENNEIYYGSGSEFDMYRLQPLERDAYDYAETEMNNVFADLETKFGENQWFDYFSNTLALDKIEAEMTALKRCGLDYIQKIDALIHQRYQEKLEKEAKAKVKESFWGKSPIEMLDSFKFFKMSNRDLISEAVEERTALGEIINWKERNNELER